jgi:uncharacterized protein YjbI with pentapeptide repeats
MADFIGETLTGSRFERADLSGSEFVTTNLSGSRFRNIDLSGSVLRGIALVDVEIDAMIVNVTINGIDIWPLIDAELNRRDPDRATMRRDYQVKECLQVVLNEEWEHHRFAERDLAILEVRS